MESIVNSILDWISANPHWAGLVVFAIAFLESLAIIGLAMPGWLLLVGVGSLIGAGNLNFWWMSLASFSGAALGQALSYWFGFYHQQRIHHWSWFEKHQNLTSKAEVFFKKHGFAGILIGQFIGPIRAVISLVAGILNMPAQKFLLAVLIASMIWAPIYLMPGVILGAALTFEQQQMWLLIGLLVSIAVSLWLLIKFMLDYFSQRRAAIKGLRKVTSLLLAMFLASIIIFLLNSSYGSLMYELSTKIWQVIA